MQTKENVRQMCDSLMEMKSQYKDIGFELKELFLVIYRKFVQHSGSSRNGSSVASASNAGKEASASATTPELNMTEGGPGMRHTLGVTRTNQKPVKSAGGGGTGPIKAKDFTKIINGWEKVFEQDPKRAIGFVYSEDNEDMFYSPSEEISDAILAAIEEIQQGKTAAPKVSSQQQKLGVETGTWSPEEKREFLENQLKTFLPQKMEAKQIEEEKKRVLNQLIRDESFLRACKPFTDLPPTVKEFINICYQLGRDDVPKYERLYDLTRHWGGRRQELDKGRILTEVSDCKDGNKDYPDTHLASVTQQDYSMQEGQDYDNSCVRGQDLSVLVEEYMEKLVEINYRPVSNPEAKPINSRLEASWI
uniref:DNA helicase n=2 Tax=Macrostomum lignano TaxID=282301 RepID=A0A1I8H2Y7_9PLAT